MPAKLDVDREAIRLLAVEYGLTETANQTGIPLNTLLSWSARFNWLNKQPKPKLPPTVTQPAIGAISPSDAQRNILEARKRRSKANLSKYVLNGSKVAARSRSPLADASKVKDLAAVMEKVWPEQQQQGNTVNLQLLASHSSIAINTDAS